jgi:hypothetical protein
MAILSYIVDVGYEEKRLIEYLGSFDCKYRYITNYV